MLKLMLSEKDRVELTGPDGEDLGTIEVLFTGRERTQLAFRMPDDVRIHRVEHPDNTIRRSKRIK